MFDCFLHIEWNLLMKQIMMLKMQNQILEQIQQLQLYEHMMPIILHQILYLHL